MSWYRLRWWLAGLAAYLFFLLATFPAAYPLAWWQKRMPDVQLSKISGSVWSGAARELTFQGQPWGALEWHVDWRALFTGHLGYRLRLRASDTDLQGRAAGNRDNLLLQDVRGHLPINRLEGFLPLPAGSLSGNLEVDLSRALLVKMRPVLADGTATFTDAALSWPQNVSLGSYQIKVSSQDKKGIHGIFIDTSGPLAVQGTVDLTPSGHYQVNGTLMSRDPNNATLTNMLGYLPVDGTGHHLFNFKGLW